MCFSMNGQPKVKKKKKWYVEFIGYKYRTNLFSQVTVEKGVNKLGNFQTVWQKMSAKSPDKFLTTDK